MYGVEKQTKKNEQADKAASPVGRSVNEPNLL